MLDCNVAVLHPCENQTRNMCFNRPRVSNYFGVVRIWFTIYTPCVTKRIASSLGHLTFLEDDTKFFFFLKVS